MEQLRPITILLTVNAPVERPTESVLDQIKHYIDDETAMDVLSITFREDRESRCHWCGHGSHGVTCFWCGQPLPPQEEP